MTAMFEIELNAQQAALIQKNLHQSIASMQVLLDLNRENTWWSSAETNAEFAAYAAELEALQQLADALDRLQKSRSVREEAGVTTNVEGKMQRAAA